MRARPSALCAAWLAGCGAPPETVDATAPAPPERDASATTAPRAAGEPDGEPSSVELDAPAPPCPEDMVYVDTMFCPDIDRRCLDLEHDPHNNLDICHEFAPEQRCRSAERRIAFCIDRYEYPNREGAHPVWMLDWYQAQATCGARGKRLCWSSEWTAACEGPEHTPFPYGWVRDHRACNIDNFFIEPARPGPRAQFFFYSKERAVADRELSRLDQSVPSGSLADCRSGFGVHDMTGNLDEWVVSDEPPREKSRWAGLKGGGWGHVRSQCRPMTYSHEPEFYYYFVGFRCCREAGGAGRSAAWTASPGALPAPSVEPRDFAPDPVVTSGAPGPSKTKFTWMRKPD
ncbi:MAG TPA: SUMF1/EgtB/PvdO family nonheme iron enzyme [Polyangiaceae bacterium]|nr:SUMF1/EgtB/PvdO family nonheme iron enzyme [Polyangiaceae bacterium]